MTAEESPVMPPAKPPVGAGLSPLFAQLVAVLMIAAGVLGVQEALQRTGVVETSWTDWLLSHLDQRAPVFTTLVVSILVVLAGLVVLLVVLRPRPRKALTLRADTGVFLRTPDLTRMARSRVDGIATVVDIDARSTRSALTMNLTSIAPKNSTDALGADVQARLASLLDSFTHPPRLEVSVRQEDLT